MGLRSWSAGVLSAASFVACSGGSATPDPVVVSAAPIEALIVGAHESCMETCARERTCLDFDDDNLGYELCEAYCSDRFSSDTFDDSPAARACIEAEVAEMACFTSLSCDEMDAYIFVDEFENPCEPEDNRAVEACERYPYYP